MGEITAPVPITADHVLSDFVCRHEELTAWLKSRALDNQANSASKTYVVCEAATNMVIGFYALAPGALKLAVAPGAIRRNMPDPIPVIVLGRLAVHGNWEGKGIGRGLLKDATSRAMQAASSIGGRALLCHAIDEDAKSFYLKHGFKESPVEPLTVMLSLKP